MKNPFLSLKQQEIVIFSLFMFLLPFQVVFAENSSILNPVEELPGESFRPQIKLEKNNLYITWTDNNPGNNEIFFSKTTDHGLNFEKSKNISKNNGSSNFPRIEAQDNHVYLVWYDYTPGNSDIFFAKSSDYGDSFEIRNLSDNKGTSFNPWIYANGQNIFVVWNDNTQKFLDSFGDKEIEINLSEYDVSTFGQDILFAHSHDYGETFDIIRLNDPKTDVWNTRMKVENENVFVVWNSKFGKTTDIYFTKSDDSGFSFSKPINLSTSKNESIDAGLSISGDNAYVVWKEKNENSTELFFSNSKNGGQDFSEPVSISNNTNSAITRDAEILSSGDNVYVVWYENLPEGGVYFLKSEDRGDSFIPSILLDYGDGRDKFPQIGLDKDQIHIIWNKKILGNYDVFMRTSQDAGNSFESTRNISQDKNDSLIFILGPQIMTQEDMVFAVFENKSDKKNSDLVVERYNSDKPKVPGMFLQFLDERGLDGDFEVKLVSTPERLEPDQEVEFELSFFNSAQNELLNNVKYSFVVSDFEGNTIANKTNQFASDGADIQRIVFQNLGPFLVSIGLDDVDNSIPTHSVLSTSAIMTVYPKSDYANYFVILGMAVAMIGVVGFLKKIRNKN